MDKLYFMNAAILANPGTYILKEIYEDEAHAYWDSWSQKESAIGHQGTVDFLKALGFAVELNRIQVFLEKGEHALVFKIKDRLPEGKTLSAEEIKKYQYQFFLLRRTM